MSSPDAGGPAAGAAGEPDSTGVNPMKKTNTTLQLKPGLDTLLKKELKINKANCSVLKSRRYDAVFVSLQPKLCLTLFASFRSFLFSHNKQV